MKIEIKDLKKSFGNYEALRGLDLVVEPGSLVALLGPSGCGKTTLLRIVAGLELASSGSLLFNGEDASKRVVRERQVGFVFQHYALFRHMTVFENVAFGLRVKPRRERPSKEYIRDRVHELLNLVQLDGLAGRYPSQLSGGQRQRVALARALAVEPKMLLLDEPFGALDAGVRRELRKWLRRLHDEVKITSLFVTHDQDEALEVADRVVIMNRGEIVQSGSPEEVYAHPATPFVFDFLGNVNLFHGRVRANGLKPGVTAEPGTDRESSAKVYIRPHEFEIHLERGDDRFPARVHRIRAAGPSVRVELVRTAGADLEAELYGINYDSEITATVRAEGAMIEAEISHERLSSLSLVPGQDVYISVKRQRVFMEDYVI